MVIYHEQLIKELSKLKFKSILDCGCGDAWLKTALPDKIYVGFDLPTDLNDELPWKDKSFDVVITVAVLSTMRDITKAIQNIKRLAKKYIVLVEFHGEYKDYSTGDKQTVRLMRDYTQVFGMDFDIINIPKSVWPGDGWMGEEPGKILIHKI